MSKMPEPLKAGHLCPDCKGTGANKERTEKMRKSDSGYIRCRSCQGNGLDPAAYFTWGKGNKKMEEGRKAIPLKGHPYHEKSDDELHYIIKDAGEAARVGRGLSSEGKYLDQVNDASTVLYHRKMGGKQLVKKPTTEETEVDEALVAKATLARYRAKSKAKFREKGGISAALDKQQDKPEMTAAERAKIKERRLNFVNEEPEPLDELSPKTLGSYIKKSSQSAGASLAISTGGTGPRRLQYYKKYKQRKAGIEKAVDKITKEEAEPLDELSPKTLKSYSKKAGSYGPRSSWGLANRGEKEEDKSMSTDGNKYPEKQERHQKAASKLYHKSNNRDKGLEHAKSRLKKEDDDMSHIVDTIMVQDEPDAQVYIDSIEARCDAIVSEFKDELKQTLFNFAEGHSTGQLKQAADAHRFHTNVHNKALGNPVKLTATQTQRHEKKREQHRKAVHVADRLRWKMQDAGVSHSSKLPKGK